MNCKEALRTQSWLDGELQGEAAREAERHVAGCAECEALAAGTAALSDAMRRLRRFRAPDGLRARIAQALDQQQRRRPRGFWTGVASGASGMALAAAAVLFTLLPPSAATLATSVVDAHSRALIEGRTIMVVSSDHHTVKPWLAAHAAVSPPATDFAAQGFALVGGRTDVVAGRRAAVTVYRRGNHDIDLFAWADRGGELPQPGLTHGFRSAFWKAGDLAFAAVSDVDAASFENFVSLARQQQE